MAYGKIYRVGFSSKNQGGYINIYKEDYTGSVSDLVLTRDSLQIKYAFKGWDDPIIGLTASLGILNQETNIFDLLPLLTAEERQYYIEVERTTPSSLIMFEGFMNCENNEQPYLRNRPISINASSYLSKLKDVKSPAIETLENETFINILLDCLAQTGSDAPIRVNCSLYPLGATKTTTNTLFNLTGVYTETFWKDNVERDSALDIIKKILTSFDSYIYWFGGFWYIERYTDIYNDPQNYVQYNQGTSYSPTSSGTAVQTTDAALNFNDLILEGQSQMIQVEPGQKEIEVNVEQNRLYNLVINDLSDAAPIYGSVPLPSLRSWEYWNESPVTWSLLGSPFKDISNAIKRSSWFGSFDEHRGIYTRFKTTIETDTALTIKFKFGTYKGSFGSWTGSWEDYTFKFHFYLKHAIDSDYIYLDGDEWKYLTKTETTGLNEIEVPGTEFDDSTVTTEVSISIPIGETTSIPTGDLDLVLGIGLEIVSRSGVGDIPCFSCFYGDIQVLSTGGIQENYFSGVINTGFLNKKSFTQNFADINDLTIKNGIFRGSSLDTRTTTWTDDAFEWLTLAKTKIRDKFRLYNKSRQSLTGKMRTSLFIKPFYLFTDSNQTGLKFILTSITYNPERDRAAFVLKEYDNTETINIL